MQRKVGQTRDAFQICQEAIRKSMHLYKSLDSKVDILEMRCWKNFRFQNKLIDLSLCQVIRH